MFQTIDQMRSEWRLLQPLAPKDADRLWRKLRLEWNYHSNHIEGNTLTYGETELLLIHDQTSGDHGFRNYLEMQAHDVAISHMRALVDCGQRLRETDVRDLNKLLLKEPFTKEAITAEGLPTKIKIIPGEYKTQPNNVRTAAGELFEFASPVDVPIRMAELVKWFNDSIEEKRGHPIEIAAQMHHEFVLIHPFGDGNGRTARILVNFALMREGYLPLIVPTQQKDSYLAALRLADAGDLSQLVKFLQTCAAVSFERGIRAARGESLDKPGDLEKEIELFKMGQRPAEDPGRIQKSLEVVAKLYGSTLEPLFEEFVGAMSRFDELFSEAAVEVRNIPPSSLATWREQIRAALQSSPRWELSSIAFSYKLKGFKGIAPVAFDVKAFLFIEFHDFYYEVCVAGEYSSWKRSYSQAVAASEIEAMVQAALKRAFGEIKRLSGSSE